MSALRPAAARLLGVLLTVVGAATGAAAHEGPPYPILVDEPVAGLTLSVWCDPDVGEGTFFLYVDDAIGAVEVELRSVPLEPPDEDSTPPAPRAAPPAELRAAAETAPERAPYQFVATLPYTHVGAWRTHFIVRHGDDAGELAHDVDVTPPGIGLLYLAWYAIPIVTLAAMWLRLLVGRRAAPSPSTLSRSPR